MLNADVDGWPRRCCSFSFWSLSVSWVLIAPNEWSGRKVAQSDNDVNETALLLNWARKRARLDCEKLRDADVIFANSKFISDGRRGCLRVAAYGRADHGVDRYDVRVWRSLARSVSQSVSPSSAVAQLYVVSPFLIWFICNCIHFYSDFIVFF